MGAEIVKEVASKTNDTAGDGTTTSVVLLEALVEEGLQHVMKGRMRWASGAAWRRRVMRRLPS